MAWARRRNQHVQYATNTVHGRTRATKMSQNQGEPNSEENGRVESTKVKQKAVVNPFRRASNQLKKVKSFNLTC